MSWALDSYVRVLYLLLTFLFFFLNKFIYLHQWMQRRDCVWKLNCRIKRHEKEEYYAT